MTAVSQAKIWYVGGGGGELRGRDRWAEIWRWRVPQTSAPGYFAVN